MPTTHTTTSPKIERRLAAILAADVAGYSGLMGADEVGTLNALKEHRRERIDPTVARHNGRIFKTTGDGLLVEFASVVDAVSCAVAIQRAMLAFNAGMHTDRQIVLRIGINVGDIIIDGDDVFGDGVNVAARLEALCEPGGVCISRYANEQVRDKLSLTFADLGEQTVKNIARAIGVFGLAAKDIAALPAEALPEPHPPELRTPPAPARRRRTGAMVAGGVVLAAILASGGAGWWLYRGGGTALHTTEALPTSPSATAQPYTPQNIGLSNAPRLSIVVLPFENLSGDPKDNYLADGITEDVTTDLSLVIGMFVIARESAYTYRSKAVDVRKLGEELGVRYVLQGSVRKLGDTLHVNVQLIATETGAHLWADRFDQKLDDLSAGQEAIVDRIGQSLNVRLADLETARSKRERPTNPDAFDLILRARSLALHPMGPEEHAERKALLEQALRLDPSSIYSMTGLADELDRWQNIGISGQGEHERAAKLVARAAAIDPNDPHVLEAEAHLLLNNGRYREAISASRRLLDQYPNSYSAYQIIALCLNSLGRFEEAIPMLETAIRRDPRSPWNYDRYAQLAMAFGLLHRYEESITWNRRALAAVPPSYTSLRAEYNLRIASVLASHGSFQEAHRAVAEANRIWPFDTARSHAPGDWSNHVWAGLLETYQLTLRAAGLRDHADEDADFAVPSDGNLRDDYAGLTPTTVPGAKTIRTPELQQLLEEQKPLVVDPLLYSWGRSIPGAIGLQNAGHGGSTSDEMQGRLRKKMQQLTKGDLTRAIVAVGWNSERFDGRNLALRLVALGYTSIYWYRGGREAWEVAGLPETQVDVQDW
jgi:adenylate cyclase